MYTMSTWALVSIIQSKFAAGATYDPVPWVGDRADRAGDPDARRGGLGDRRTQAKGRWGRSPGGRGFVIELSESSGRMSGPPGDLLAAAHAARHGAQLVTGTWQVTVLGTSLQTWT